MTYSATSLDQVEAALAFVRKQIDFPLQAAIVLGSGMSEVADRVANAQVIPYGQIPNFPMPSGSLVCGSIGAATVAVLKSRAHVYEGHNAAEVAFGIRLLGRMGVRNLMLTNAAGAVNPAWRVGDIMVLIDHINQAGVNPLRGRHEPEWGERFVDMSGPYSSELLEHCLAAAAQHGIEIRQGTYAWMLGPSFETPAEIEMLARMGVDAVGMSTVPEAIVANQMGMRTLAISVLTNMAAGIGDDAPEHDEVMSVAAKSTAQLGSLVEGVLERLDQE